MTRKALVIFGATGSLAKYKIFPALLALQGRKNLPRNLEIISYTRRDIDGVDLLNSYNIKGELDNLDALRRFIATKKIGKIFFYLALPPNLYEYVIGLICEEFRDLKFRIALEKPFGVSLGGAETLAGILKKYGENNFYLVDHYLAKKSVRDFPSLSEQMKNLDEIESVEVNMLEKGDLSERGAFFDSLGTLKDTVQSHLLNLISEFLQKEPRLLFFKRLKYKKGSAVFAQYDGYRKAMGVNSNSQTETYFKAEFIYNPGQDKTDIEIILRSGKALNITRTFLTIFYKEGSSLCLEINPKENAHEYVIREFLKGGRRFSVSPKEAVGSWKVVEQILEDKKEMEIRIYSKGAGVEEIEERI